MKSKSGFTIIEVCVVVVVIAILVAVGVNSYNAVQRDTRDDRRNFNVTLIAEALEAYHEKHGEYPSPRALTNDIPGNTGQSVAALLGVNKDILVAPRAPSGTSNSITASLGAVDVIAYTASSSTDNPACQSSASSGCESFTLRYNKEADGSTVTIKSRYGN